MSEKQGRQTEISRRETEMYRVNVIQSEMANAVRFIGGEGSAKDQITRAARAAGLPITVVERLRWKKIKRVPADIADAIREAVERHKIEEQNRAKHEQFILSKRLEVLEAQLLELNPDRYGPEIDALRRQVDRLRG
ncbi:hypothetical protein GCM10011491_30540 [Brucella endophytica]|uniref:Uncharacterized protein n=1 Tax=Brucella endophytica TaxID=1963359 RepID=A0A916SJ64_9HYPH|nr:hypothetical protein [Brucella endophytica]GGB00204.1 hypothetical protein GCM10011491_30540 [Brucella endophytica]